MVMGGTFDSMERSKRLEDLDLRELLDFDANGGSIRFAGAGARGRGGGHRRTLRLGARQPQKALSDGPN